MIKFVGRTAELAQIRKLVASNRLVTIVGVGGVGKTRLIGKLIDDLPSIFVSLESVDIAVAGELLDATIRDLESDAASVPRDTIVVLDNAEHVLEILRTKIDEILLSGYRIIITSREPLKHPLESVMRLLPFDRPHTELFLRTILTQQNLVVETELATFNYDAIHDLLDGLALAVEIVATKLSVLSYDEQREFLENQVFSDHPESNQIPRRHRSLTHTFEWSWATLSEKSKALLSQVSLFSKSFSRASVNAICETDELAVDLALSDLMQKSLLRRETVNGKTRFKMLHAVRTFAVSKLSAKERSTTMNKIAVHHIEELFSTTKLIRRSHELWLPLKQMYKSEDVAFSVKLKIYRGLQSLESIVMDTSFRNDFDDSLLHENSIDADFVGLDIAQYNGNWAEFDRKFKEFLARDDLNNGIIVDVLWMLSRFRKESIDQIDALKTRLKTIDDHSFSFWVQEATFRSRNGMAEEAKALFERANNYAEDAQDAVMINVLSICRGFIALREHRFEDANYFLERANHESTSPTAKGYRIDVLRRLGKNQEALKLGKTFFEEIYDLNDFATAILIAWNLFLLTGSRVWLQRLSSMRDDSDDFMPCYLMYLGVSELYTDPKSAMNTFQRATRLSVNPEELGATLALMTIAGDPKWEEIKMAWADTPLEDETSIVRRVLELQNGPRHEITAFFQSAAQRPQTEIHQRHVTYLARLGGFDLDDVWEFILNGQEEKPILRIDFNYKFCILPGAIRVDLSRRGPMKKILKALVEAKKENQGGLTTWEAMEAGWPEEKVRTDAAIAKLYTTINNLRKLGFRDIVETSDAGYRISQEYSVQIL